MHDVLIDVIVVFVLVNCVVDIPCVSGVFVNSVFDISCVSG